MSSLIDGKFTVQDGIEIQKINLADWKTKLNAKMYKALVVECERQNALPNINNGFDVFRGSSVYFFIANFKR
jgi:hypothetical protein